MEEKSFTRRSFVTESLLLAAPVLMAAAAPPLALAEANPSRRLKVVCIGGHPDDPESGCGGTLARYADLGHSITIIYLTRGERGIRGKGLEESAKIRSAEGENACKIIGAKPVFFGQIDGATEINRANVDAMKNLLSAENADVVFAHWPVDTHMDHQVASMLAMRACMALGQRQHLFFLKSTAAANLKASCRTHTWISPRSWRRKNPRCMLT